MSDTTYIAAPAGLTAHSFDDNGKLHSLPIAAWRAGPPAEDGELPNLRLVVVTAEGTLREDERAVVITGAGQLPSGDALYANLLASLQAVARNTPAGRLPVGKPLGDDDLRALDEAVSGDKKRTQDPERVLTRYLSSDGGRHLSVLGRVYHVEGADLMISENGEPSHPALTAADIAVIDLAKHREVRVP